MGLMFDSYVLDILVAFITIGYLFYAFFTSSFNHWKDRRIPFVKPIVFVGNLKDSLLSRKPIFEIHKEIYNELASSAIGGYFEFKNPALIIRNPELIEKILIKDFGYFHDRGIPYDTELEPLSGNLVNVGGSYWRNLRYKMTPTFTTGKLKSMFGQVSKCADNLITYIEKHSMTENCLNGKSLASRFSIGVIASCAFGLELNYDSEEGVQFRNMVNTMFSPSKLQLIRFSLNMYYPRLARLLKMNALQKEVSSYFLQIIKDTIKYRKENHINRNDFVQLLMTLKEQEENGKDMHTAEGEGYSEEDTIINQMSNVPDHNAAEKTKIFTEESIAAQSFVFLTAGSESTSSTINFCLYSIAANPDVQKKLQNEVDVVMAKHNGEISYQAIKEMIYLEQVVNETLRKYPIGSFLFRKCNKPYNVPDTQYVIEPGTRIIIPVYALHNDPAYFPNPEKFNPERFADDRTIRRGTYLPFGDGPRICIAMRFALLEAKVCVATIVSHFNIRVNKKTQEPIRFAPEAFLLQTVGGIWLAFDKRTRTQ